MNAQKKKERRALRRAFSGCYPLPYAQALLDKMMEQCLHYRPPSAADIQAAELFRFYTRLGRWLQAELRQQA